MHICVVGDGYTAGESARACLAACPTLHKLTLVGPQANTPGWFGRGVAYGGLGRRLEYCMGTPLSCLGKHFETWVHENWKSLIGEIRDSVPSNPEMARWCAYYQEALQKEALSTLHLPRVFFGDFLSERFEQTLHTCALKGRPLIERINDKVSDIQPQGASFILTLGGGGSLEAEGVLVAVGVPFRHIEGTHHVYGHEEALLRSARDGGITLVGAGASMLDAVGLIRSQTSLQDQPLTIISPEGSLPTEYSLPREHSPSSHKLPVLKLDLSSRKAFMKTVIRERDAALAQGATIYTVNQALLQWRDKVEKAFPKRQEPQWEELYRTVSFFCPHAVHELKRLRHTGQVSLCTGRVMKATNEGLLVRHKERTFTLSTRYALNVAGVALPSQLPPDHLLTTMLRRSLFALHPQTQKIEVGAGGQTRIKNLFLINPFIGSLEGNIPLFPLFDLRGLRSLAREAAGMLASAEA